MSVNKSKPQTHQTTTSQPVTLQDIDGIAIAGNSAPVTITDGGAIQGSIELAGNLGGGAFDLADSNVSRIANLTTDFMAMQQEANKYSLASSLGAAESAANLGYQFAMDAGRSDVAVMKDTTQKVLIVIGIVAAAWVLHGWKK